jgi:hypothetical protein
MKTEFDNLRLNDLHSYENDRNGDKHVVKIYCGDLLIAKKVQKNKSIRFFGVNGYQQYLQEESPENDE